MIAGLVKILPLKRIATDLSLILVPYVKLEVSDFLFLNSGTPLVLEDGNSKRCAA
jgi:hypothetical protein